MKEYMRYCVVKFEINNNQEEYAECIRIIDILESKRQDNNVSNHFISKVTYQWGDYAVDFWDVMKGKFVSCENGLPKISANDRYSFFFEVNCAGADDVINLIYYCLVNDRIGGKGKLCIKCQSKQRANIRDLLSDILISGRIKEYYELESEGYKRIHKGNCKGDRKGDRKERRNRSFSPIFKIDQTGTKAERVSYWRQPISTFLKDLYLRIPMGESDRQYTINYFLPHISPYKIQKKYPQDVWKSDALCREIQLINSFVECFCTSVNKSSVKDVKERYECWKSKELFAKIEHMPLLAMYIFCLMDHYQKDNIEDSLENIEQEIFDARDMAEGLLQILENIYHSEYHKGYFCFRIHNNAPDRSEAYLKKEYSEYMESVSESNSLFTNYLEMKVADFSHKTIPVQFYESFTQRLMEAESAERETYGKIQKEVEKITVASFYDETTEFWKQYNALSDNVIHHYGIQIFQSLVACYQGYFQVCSRSMEKPIPEKEYYSTLKGMEKSVFGIPGTQYDALLPFGIQNMMQNISMDVNLKYDNHLIAQYEICKNEIKFNTELIKNILNKEENKLAFQYQKELVVRRLADRFEKAIEKQIKEIVERQAKKVEKKYIIHISAKDIAITAIEIFCKTVMLYIARNGQKRECYMMLTECTQSHFVELVRMMALFYNKQGVNPLMEGTQIFMSGENESEEFLITGTNLEKAVVGTEKLSFARSVHPNCLKLLRKSLKNHMMTGAVSPNDIINIVPFDMISYSGAEKTLLENRVKKVLEDDVQSELFGCKLEGLHVRIGSKIHIRTFYEAELLFHNNYYTLRFAYWLYNKLISDDRLQKEEQFVLVGYENYSEMLINELCNIFHSGSGIKVDYIIYEERAMGKFRGKRDFSQYKDAQFVIIVPINSTSTTHIKTVGFLEKTIRNSLKDNQKYDIKSEKVLNYGIVLIGSEAENMYWDRVQNEKNTIISKIDGKILKYYVEVQTQWESPLRCKVCFPNENYVEELPLVETNKESVVPMHAISIRKRNSSKESTNGNDWEIDRMNELSKILIYKHIERNGNHFNYYFSTEKLWENEQIKKNIEKWLKRQSEKLFGRERYKVYDIIVAPLHYSNTVFVEEVNNWLFHNAALVLHFDADREFRMNVRTKYSAVQQLYDNLCMDHEKSVINFHYIDDTIISGRTYQRMKSLVCSLIKRSDCSVVEINVFKSVVLLLNRLSTSSIRDFIENPQYFIAYFDLSISSMRVNSDACILCKKYAEWNQLSEQAALNEVYSYWKNKAEGIKCIPIEELETLNKSGSVKYPERAPQYMIASHRSKKLLDELCEYANIDEIIEQIVKMLFPETIDTSLGELIAMLKVLGRPFLTFRREVKEAAFKLMLVMLDTLLNDDEPRGDGRKLQSILQAAHNDCGKRIIIVGILINRLAELGSNYIIRKTSMEKILNFAQKHIADEKENKTFVANYLNRIKQLVGQSNDFAKGLYLEYLLLYGKEYDNIDNEDKVSLAGDKADVKFLRSVYLENTKLANYGIEYLADCFWNSHEYTEEGIKEALNSNYYFDNFIQYLAFHKAVEVDEKEKVIRFVSADALKKLQGMIKFELLYQRIFGRKKISGLEEMEPEVINDYLHNKFGEMMEYLKEASGASDGEIIVPYEKDKENTDGIPKYIALGLQKGGTIATLTNKEENLLKFMRQEREYHGDTYAICSGENEDKRVLFKFYNKIEPADSAATEIYMLFLFEKAEEGEILHDIKNILIFRNKISRILNLSNDVLLQNLADNLFYKQQMLKSRATGHMELSEYLKRFKNICKLVDADEFAKKSREEQKIIEEYFDLLVNSMIGFMNAQVLGGKGSDYAWHSKMKEFSKFWEIEKAEIRAAERVWKLRVELAEDRQMESSVFRKMKSENAPTPIFEVLLILFLAVFQNIQKHRMGNEEGLCDVYIYAEKEGIHIKNRISDDMKEAVEMMIRPEAYRAGEGISLAVIYDICRAYYPKIKYSEMFCLITENGGKECWFVVKLPITEQKNITEGERGEKL